ncbi:MAG TPA: FAD-dependent oxidoreductase [Streptosporangiaceae bacterium]|jgi:3-phenylpropionate/trans-cinnamate dioxygenase ferredoxin reductase component|nr:FAD-dependent oxidoreductase [Streptosporangiaceae bacterium]
MAKDDAFVIVGASLAGANAAQALRDEGFDGSIVLIGDEREQPYERPPLSKDYLMGKSGKEKLYALPADWYAQNNVELRLGESAIGVDRGAKQVTLASGETVGYTKLLLTTGSSPRRLSIPGADADGVHYLRRVQDSDAIKAAIDAASKIAVIGAGWIGLEAASAARAAGVEVSVIEMAELPLLRVLGREVAQVFADLHKANGTELIFGATVAEIIVKDGKASGVRLGDGRDVEADAVIVGVGITPNVGLAADAGLAVDNGIVVDARLQTSDPDIFAAGDVANAFHPAYGKHLRVEHWSNARHQPRAAAKAMLGQDVSFDRVPYFFTDQYDLGMEYAGYVEPEGYDRVVFRGDVPGREFIAFWVGSDGRVLAGMNVNIWDVNDQLMELVRTARPVDAAALADPGTPLDSLAS